MTGFESLNTGPRKPGPMPVGKPPMAGGGASFTGSGPNSAPQTPAAPASQKLPFGQANDPGAYGTPGAPGSSPLGMWQQWLNSMGPFLAQMPASQPNVESGGLSSLAPSPSNLGTAGYYGAGVGPDFNNRGFRTLALQ